MADIDRAELRAAMIAELRAAWTALQQAHPAERFYSFGVYTAPCAEYLMVTASTEEGLAAATETYHAQDGRDRTLRRVSLRWSPCDSPLHEEGQELLTRSDAVRQSGPTPTTTLKKARPPSLSSSRLWSRRCKHLTVQTPLVRGRKGNGSCSACGWATNRTKSALNMFGC